MPQFDEHAFIYALTSRPEDCRRFSGHFLPEWLNDSTLIPICREVFDFLRGHGTPPSIHTLRSALKDKDQEVYNLRYKVALDKVTNREPDLSEMIYTISQARDVAIIRSLQELFNSPASLRMQANFEGKELIREVQRWSNKFIDLTDDQTLTIKEAIEYLIEQSSVNKKLEKIPSGIKPIDMWTRGGTKPKNLGIILGASGHGKSATLTNIAHATSAFAMKNTWLITNEMCMEEQTERLLARITNTSIHVIEDSPHSAYRGLEKRWMGLDERLVLSYINRDASFDEIEGEMMKWTNITGWKPEVIVLDFLERMRPNDKGYNRDKSWDWLGAIARDATRLAKRHRLLIWTAAQLNRSALNAEVIQSSMMQSSIKHFQEAAVVVGVRKVKEEEGFEIIEFCPMKFRHNKFPSSSMYMKADLDKMVITDVVRESSEEDTPDVERKNGKKLRKYKE
jgi:replicative DNA helicase